MISDFCVCVLSMVRSICWYSFARFFIPNPKPFRFVAYCLKFSHPWHIWLFFKFIQSSDLRKRRRKIMDEVQSSRQHNKTTKVLIYWGMRHDAKAREAEQHCNRTKNRNKAIKNSIKHSKKCADGGEWRASKQRLKSKVER